MVFPFGPRKAAVSRIFEVELFGELDAYRVAEAALRGHPVDHLALVKVHFQKFLTGIGERQLWKRTPGTTVDVFVQPAEDKGIELVLLPFKWLLIAGVKTNLVR